MIPITTIDLNASGQMGLSDARVVDIVLTQVALGYTHMEHIHSHMFSPVEVMRRAGKIIQFGTEAFYKHIGLGRAPGSLIQQVQYEFGSTDFVLTNRALLGIVPDEIREEALSPGGPGIDTAAQIVRQTMQTIELQIELEAAKLATTPTTYRAENRKSLDAADQWEKEASDLMVMVEAAKEQIAGGIGQNPNFMAMGPLVYRGLRTNPKIRKEIYQTQRVASVGLEELQRYFDIEKIMVGEARYKETDEGLFLPVWGNNVVLCYNNTASIANLGAPSFGYGYRLRGYPYSGPGMRIEDRNSWGYKVVSEDTPVVVGPNAGFLFSNVVGLAL